ncbi:zinc ribbon domain-containing protein [Clostridium pasteurianum]|uniref:Zn-ribbon protein, possibly nucleic acid-binding protein n=1 Tax=Clostridium pasteurianum BC1 TaxID=86416 RepID=R4K1X7_CLOPA|nr:C4-type zinc ribbon domain-containing protein [Clostridium pasteurianum]AGK97097.1 Zn-ribbon protein, possibly nucleic acid-binding protein [Clostridium pasteurianum BC1]
MGNSKLLLELQRCYQDIEESKKVLNDGSYLYLLKKMKKEFENMKDKYNGKRKALGDLKIEYTSIGKDLRNLKNKIDKNEHDLYNNADNDVKSINALQNNIEINKEKLKALEDKAIELLEVEEKLKLDIESLKMDLINVKNNFYNYKKVTSEKINDAKDKLKESEDRVEELKKIIPENELKVFYSMIDKRKVAVVKLKNEICEGCKMRVSSVTLDNIYKGKDIVYCDNCGRILIYDNGKKLKEAK